MHRACTFRRCNSSPLRNRTALGFTARRYSSRAEERQKHARVRIERARGTRPFSAVRYARRAVRSAKRESLLP